MLYSFGNESGLFFRAIAKTLIYHNNKELVQDKDYDRGITCNILAIRSDGERFDGKLKILLKDPQSGSGWHGMCRVEIGNESIIFECIRTSQVYGNW